MQEERFRTNNQLLYGTCEVTGFWPNGTPGSTQYIPTLYPAWGSVKEITDMVPSHYAPGSIQMNPVEVKNTAYECSEQLNMYGNHPVWGRREVDGPIAAFYDLSDIERDSGYVDDQDLTDAKAYVLAEAYDRMYSADLESLVELGEFKKTLKMLKHPLKGSLRLFKDGVKVMRRYNTLQKKVEGVKAITGALAKVWLEVRFGFRPLMYSVKEAITLADETFNDPKIYTGHHVSRANVELPTFEWLDDPYSLQECFTQLVLVTGTPAIGGSRSFTVHRKVHAGVIWRLKDGRESSVIRRKMGLRLNQLPSVIWELTPWSFFIDYFIDVGSWLQAVCPDPSIEVLGNWVSVKTTLISTITDADSKIHVYNAPETDYHQSTGWYKSTTTRMIREVNLELTVAPRLNPQGLGIARSLDSFALFFLNYKHALNLFRAIFRDHRTKF